METYCQLYTYFSNLSQIVVCSGICVCRIYEGTVLSW
uniref:Uncharacterized protein n=1 Tax=Rhizophora mucronata TaxID=61149 RepID=A0A2P2N3C2_RHIMU